MSSQQIQNLIQTLGRVEFLTEQVVPYILKNDPNPNKTLMYLLLIFEGIKCPLRLYNFINQNKNIEITHENIHLQMQERIGLRSEIINNKFQNYDKIILQQKYEDYIDEDQKLFESYQQEDEEQNHINSNSENISEQEKLVQNGNSQLKLHHSKIKLIQNLKNHLENIKNRALLTFDYNKDFYQKSNIFAKNSNIINTLPIPSQLLPKNLTNQKNYPLIVGEILYIIRPLIYCFFIKKKGVHSYTPLLISLAVDIIRWIICLIFKPKNKVEESELKSRNKTILFAYLLRNPFYSNIMKAKVLQPFINKLCFGRLQFLQNLIFTVIEMRCSLSLQM